MHLREENYWAREGEKDVSGGDVGNASLGVRIILFWKKPLKWNMEITKHINIYLMGWVFLGTTSHKQFFLNHFGLLLINKNHFKIQWKFVFVEFQFYNIISICICCQINYSILANFWCSWDWRLVKCIFYWLNFDMYIPWTIYHMPPNQSQYNTYYLITEHREQRHHIW